MNLSTKPILKELRFLNCFSGKNKFFIKNYGCIYNINSEEEYEIGIISELIKESLTDRLNANLNKFVSIYNEYQYKDEQKTDKAFKELITDFKNLLLDQISELLLILNQNKVIHRDLKIDNFMYNGSIYTYITIHF